MGETLSSMTYSAEAVIHVGVGLPTSRIDEFREEANGQLIGRHLDLIEENCEVALVKLVNYQQRVNHGYNKGVKCREFIPGKTRTRLRRVFPDNIHRGTGAY